MSMKWVTLVVVIAVVMAGCSGTTTLGACYGGSPQFPLAMLDGPQLTPEQFAETDEGRILEAFFVGGPGAVEGQWFHEADGFSIVSPSLVLGYEDGAVTSKTTIEDGRVTSGGSCIPTLVRSGAETARWTPTEGWDRNSTVIPIKVEGGACVTGTRTRVITRIVDVDVTESADEVQVVVWTKERFTLSCAGVGIDLDSQIDLSSPLGDRPLYDAGFTPPERVDE
jgi:hypothetical protein